MQQDGCIPQSGPGRTPHSRTVGEITTSHLINYHSVPLCPLLESSPFVFCNNTVPGKVAAKLSSLHQTPRPGVFHPAKVVLFIINKELLNLAWFSGDGGDGLDLDLMVVFFNLNIFIVQHYLVYPTLLNFCLFPSISGVLNTCRCC